MIPLDIIIQVGNGIKVGQGITIGANAVKQSAFFIKEITLQDFITEVNSGSNYLIGEPQ